MNETIKILLVEDDELDQKTVRRHLAKADQFGCIFECELAGDLSSAVNKITSSSFQIILLDLNLPDSNGLATFNKIKSLTHAAIIILTGQHDQKISFEALKDGAQDFLIKGGFDQDVLHRSIRYSLQRAQINEELKAAKEHAEQIIIFAQEAFVAVDEHGRIIEWNPEAEKTFGWSRNEILGRKLVETIVPVAFREEYSKEHARFMATGENHFMGKHIELSALHKNGTEFSVELTLNSLKKIDGELTFNAFIQDITERKKIEHIKNEFISMASHELRTPMAIIQAGVANLTCDILGDLNDQQKKITTIIENNAKRLNKIINNLLDISRLESGQMRTKFEKLPLQKLMGEVAAGLEKLAAEKKLTFNFLIDQNVPQEIFADEELLIQIINNLTSNSLRYASTKIEIKVSTVPSGVIFSVGNDGTYLAPEDIAKLFQKFSQVKRPQGGTGYKGTGLGLAICKEIIAKHGGKIWVESVENEMTCFKFIIPNRG